MKGLIENAMAAAMQANIPGLAASLPEHQSDVLPEEGTCLVVSAEVDHRAGPLNVVDVTFRLSTPAPESDRQTVPREHGEYERAVRIVAQAVSTLDCGLGVTLHGKAFYQGQGGGVDGNRWVSEIRFRYGATEA